jgi:3-hydroxyisobutyrate dehydrogenase
MKVGWIGIGRMGAPMAARLVRAGYAVVVWNRTRAKAESGELRGAKVADSRSGLADVDALFTMLSTGQDVIEVCFGTEGIFREGLKRSRACLSIALRLAWRSPRRCALA